MEYKIKLKDLIEKLKKLEDEVIMHENRFNNEHLKSKIDDIFNSYMEEQMGHLPEWL
jgi:hypothetical protein